MEAMETGFEGKSIPKHCCLHNFKVTLDFLLPSKCPPAEVVRPHSQKQLAAGSGDIVT